MKSVRYLVSADINEIMSSNRFEASEALCSKIQVAANAQNLGAKVLFVGLQDLHPPVKVAPEYEKVVGAIQQRKAKIVLAEADAIRTNNLASAQAVVITNTAQADRLKLELTAVARGGGVFQSDSGVCGRAIRLQTTALCAGISPRGGRGAPIHHRFHEH